MLINDDGKERKEEEELMEEDDLKYCLASESGKPAQMFQTAGARESDFLKWTLHL